MNSLISVRSSNLIIRSCITFTTRGTGFDVFFFNDTATTEIYTLSLHDALPISSGAVSTASSIHRRLPGRLPTSTPRDRKSTRLNSSHGYISYAVFCLKKKIMESYVLTATAQLRASHYH